MPRPCKKRDYFNGLLTKLQALTLGNTEISDKAIPSLLKLRNLEYLDLSGTKVTDHGAKQLVGLTKLTNLCVNKDKVSEETCQSLRANRDLTVSRE